MEGFKDSPASVFGMGFLVPILIIAVVICNVVNGEGYYPADNFEGQLLDGLIVVYDDPWRFCGTILVKLGIAGGIFSWFALANFDRTEDRAQEYLLISIVVAVVGLLGLVVSLFL